LNLPFQAAVKTGTSNDSRDNWTLGYTPDLAVGVWVGNADYTAMLNTTGVTGAGPIWAQFMTYAINHLTGGNPRPFSMPSGIVQRTICTVSGAQPSQWCPSQRQEYFATDQPPLPPEDDLWKNVQYDTWTGLLASPECTSNYTDERLAINVTDQSARDWIRQDKNGQQWARDNGFTDIFFAPDRMCAASDPRPQLQFVGLQDGQTITTSSLDISIVANATGGFRSWRLDWSSSQNPGNFTNLTPDNTTPVTTPSDVYTWDLTGMSDGQILLRLYMKGQGSNYADQNIHLNLIVPTPTPLPTATSTPTPTITPSPLPTDTPTDTAIPTDTPTPTSVPTQ
jgi:membrane peptidoglycan carboxypeptidase